MPGRGGECLNYLCRSTVESMDQEQQEQNQVLVCKKKGCGFKQKEHGYCGKHKRIAIQEKATQEGKRLCDIKRGCYTELLQTEKKCSV